MFQMNTLGNYHDIYLKTGVLLLAGVFKKFINACIEYYGLNPCRYFSSTGLSWYAVLKMTWTELELISDIDMHLLMKKECEEVFLTLLKDLVKQIINTCNFMMIKNQVNTLHIFMKIIYMVGQWVNIYLMVILND